MELTLQERLDKLERETFKDVKYLSVEDLYNSTASESTIKMLMDPYKE